MFYTYFTLLLTPPASLISLILLGLFLIIGFKRHKIVLGLTFLCSLMLYILSTPIVAQSIMRSYVIPYSDLESQVREIKPQAIIILSAGVNNNTPEYGGETVDARSLERIRYGAKLARQYNLPILVTGGTFKNNQSSVADLMAKSLREDFRAEVKWIEPLAQTTYENARFSSEILKKESISKIILVSHANHLRRSKIAFDSYGFETIFAPTIQTTIAETDPSRFFPSIKSLEQNYIAMHEIIGFYWYKYNPFI